MSHSSKGDPKPTILQEIRAFVFDKDDTLIDSTDKNKALDPKEQRILFNYLKNHPKKCLWGIVSTSGGDLRHGKLKPGKGGDDSHLHLWRRDVLGESVSYNGKQTSISADDETAKRRGRLFSMTDPNVVKSCSFGGELLASVEADEQQRFNTLLFGDASFEPDAKNPQRLVTTFEYQKGNIHEVVIEANSPERYVDLQLGEVTLRIDLLQYIKYRPFHITGDNKLLQTLAGLASQGVAVLPSEGMQELGISEVIAPDHFQWIESKQIFFTDDKPECVALCKKAGINAVMADNNAVAKAKLQESKDREPKTIERYNNPKVAVPEVAEERRLAISDVMVPCEEALDSRGFSAAQEEGKKAVIDDSQPPRYIEVAAQHLGFDNFAELAKQVAAEEQAFNQAKHDLFEHLRPVLSSSSVTLEDIGKEGARGERRAALSSFAGGLFGASNLPGASQHFGWSTEMGKQIRACQSWEELESVAQQIDAKASAEELPLATEIDGKHSYSPAVRIVTNAHTPFDESLQQVQQQQPIQTNQYIGPTS